MNPQPGTERTLPDQAARPGTASAPDGFFRELLDAVPDAMIVVGTDGRMLVVNTVAVQMFGYPRAQLIGRPVEMLLPERHRARHRKHRKGYAAGPGLRAMGIGMELTALRSDGAEVPVEITLSPIKTPSGTLVVGAIRDVTERRRVQAELEAARRAAERATEANMAFLSAASHDLRQPVQALRLLNGALRRSATDPLLLKMIEGQRESLDAVANLLESLVETSRVEAGIVEPNIDVSLAADEGSPGPRPRGGFVLIVEDDVQVAKAWNRLLRSEGYRVAGAGTTAELRTLIERLDAVPDLVLSDYHLADGANGIQAVQLIREAAGACVPALILTGDAAKVSDEIEKLENSRMLSKPIVPGALLRLARAAIENGLPG